MKETKKNKNNNVHLYGYINNIRMNEYEREGKKMTAINLDVATLETFKKGDEFQNRRTYHDVSLFTDDKKTIKMFKDIEKDLAKEGAKAHTISMDGTLVNKEDSRDMRIIAKEDSIDVDVKQADKEVRNRAELVGNVAAVNVFEDKNFASVNIIHHFRPEGSDKEFETSMQVRVDGDRKFSKDTYEKLKSGEIGVGDFIKVGGQLHNNNYTKEGEEKVYSVALDLTSAEVIRKKGEKKAEGVEKKAEAPKEKAAPKQKAEPKEKATPKKKPVSRKKGVTM